MKLGKNFTSTTAINKSDFKITFKYVNITKYEKYVNQNFSEVSPHTSQNGRRWKLYKQ